jgi:GT2 family glycosyltransferase
VKLSIVIVSHNAAADLERCLAALQRSAIEAEHEIIVVDNASRDGSVETARRFPAVKVVALDMNRGFAAGNNAGIRVSCGDSLLLLNSDTVVPPGAIDRLLHELDEYPDAAVVGPRLVDAQGRPELSFGRMITPWNEMRQKRLVAGVARGDAAITAQVEAMTRRRQWPDWVSGACLLVRRRDAEAVGLMDERYFLYTEDVDFCAAIRARGRRVLFTPEAEIVHVRGRSAEIDPAATNAAYQRSRMAFYQKHHPWWAPVLRQYVRLTGGYWGKADRPKP